MVGIGEKGPLVLVVDDDESTAEVYQFVLAAAGYRVARATNGVEGLLLEEKLAPELIIVDVHMPIIGGLEMLRHRNVTKQVRTPVIVNSADPLTELAALEAGAALFLPKPLSAGDLLAAVEATLQRADVSAEARRQRSSDVVDEYVRDGTRRERIIERLDPKDPELQDRIGALVRWLAGYYEMRIAWVDVLHRGSVFVEAAFSRPSARPSYDLINRVLLSENIADARSPFLIGDLQAAPWFATHPAARAGYRFFAGVPLCGPENVRLGALCIADVHPRAFDAANLTVLEHCGTEFGHRIAQHAGADVSGPFLFDRPSVFSAETMNVLISAELLRARRRHTAFELALIRLASSEVDRVADYAQDILHAVDGRGCAVASHSASVFAVLARADDARSARDRMDAALRALREARAEGVLAAAVVANAGGATATVSANDVIRAAQSVLARVPPGTWMVREELSAAADTVGSPTR